MVVTVAMYKPTLTIGFGTPVPIEKYDQVVHKGRIYCAECGQPLIAKANCVAIHKHYAHIASEPCAKNAYRKALLLWTRNWLGLLEPEVCNVTLHNGLRVDVSTPRGGNIVLSAESRTINDILEREADIDSLTWVFNGDRARLVAKTTDNHCIFNSKVMCWGYAERPLYLDTPFNMVRVVSALHGSCYLGKLVSMNCFLYKVFDGRTKVNMRNLATSLETTLVPHDAPTMPVRYDEGELIATGILSPLHEDILQSAGYYQVDGHTYRLKPTETHDPEPLNQCNVEEVDDWHQILHKKIHFHGTTKFRDWVTPEHVTRVDLANILAFELDLYTKLKVPLLADKKAYKVGMKIPFMCIECKEQQTYSKLLAFCCTACRLAWRMPRYSSEQLQKAFSGIDLESYLIPKRQQRRVFTDLRMPEAHPMHADRAQLSRTVSTF